ncbi:MAG: radical SAM protein [Elusimicrobiota bacterium]
MSFVLLCYSRNTPYSYDAHTPVSIFALGTYLERNGVEVEYFDERLDGQDRFDELAARRPLLAGFSVIGGYQIASARRLSRRLRELSGGTRIVWGGICPTTLTDTVLKEDYVDYAVRGEGEATLLELFRRLSAGQDCAGLAGLGGGAERLPLDIDSLPFVYQGKAALELKRHLKRRSIREAVGYEASRGCPFRCEFCYSPNFHGAARVKSTAKVAAELAALKELGVDELDIYDDTLFGGRSDKFADYLKLLKGGGFSWIGNFRINMLDRELLARLEDSGCKWVYFGIESDDDETLASIRKGITAREIDEGIGLMSRSTLPTVYSIIHGLPLEGEKDKARQCLDFAEKIHARHPGAEIQVQSYVPLPGTALYGAAVRLGFCPPADMDGWVRHDHFGVSSPWQENTGLAAKLYLSTFLAFRYRRHLSHFPVCLAAYPLHLLSRWRIRTRFFGLYFERALYRLGLAAAEALTSLYYRR